MTYPSPRTLDEAKEVFSFLPSAVFDIFIKPLVNIERSIFDELPQGRWAAHLGYMPFDQFAALSWKYEELTIKADILNKPSRIVIEGLIRNHIFNERTEIEIYVANSRERFLWHLSEIKRTGTICAPIVAVPTTQGFHILDGSHRLAAFFCVYANDVPPIPGWFGVNRTT